MPEFYDAAAVARKIETDAEAATFQGRGAAPRPGEKITDRVPNAADHIRASEKLSADIKELSPTQLRLVLGEMQRNHNDQVFVSADRDKVTGEILSLKFHGQGDMTVEANSGKLFDPKAEAALLLPQINGALADDPRSKAALQTNIARLNPTEMRLVADQIQAAHENWNAFYINRDSKGDVLGFQFNSEGKDMSLDATNGKIFHAGIEAYVCLGEVGRIFRGDPKADDSKLLLSYLLGTMSKGERSLVTTSMGNLMQGQGYVESIPGNGDIDALRFVSNGKEVTIDLADEPRR